MSISSEETCWIGLLSRSAKIGMGIVAVLATLLAATMMPHAAIAADAQSAGSAGSGTLQAASALNVESGWDAQDVLDDFISHSGMNAEDSALAKEALDAAVAAYENALADANAAQDAADRAKAVLDAASRATAAAKAKLDGKQVELEQLQAALESAIGKSNLAQDARDKAKAALERAREALAANQPALEEALNKLKEAQGVEEAAQIVSDAATEALEAAEADLAEKQAAADEAQKALDDANAQLETARKAFDAATSEAQSAKDALSAAKAKVDAIVANLQESGKAIAAAQAKYDSAQAAYDEAQTKIAEGSFGFFEAMGSTAALNALNRVGTSNLGQTFTTTDSDGKAFTSFTHKGEATDATSLENMKNSIQWMRRCNELRANEDVLPACNSSMLKVSDTLMAMAQSNANWSDSHVNHAGLAGGNYNVDENLAWNYGSDPFVQWYDNEKEVYVNSDLNGDGVIGDGRNNLTGHYLNVVRASSGSTGFAICTRGSMNGWVTFGQTFSASSYDGEPTYTVDAYEKRFMEYYDSLVTKPAETLAEAKAELETAQANAGSEALEEAQAQLAVAQNLEKEAAAKAEGAKAAFDQAAADAQQAAMNQELLKLAAENAQVAKESALQKADEADKALAQAKELAASAAAAFEEAQAAVDDSAVKAAEQELKQAEEALRTALADAETTQAAVDAIRTEIEQLAGSSEAAAAEEAAKQLAFETAQATLDQAMSKLGLSEKAKADAQELFDRAVEAEEALKHVLGYYDLANAEVSAIPAASYTGGALKPKASVKLNGKALKEGADYALSYANNVNVGTARVTIAGVGTYEGSKTVTFGITAADISKAQFGKVKAQKLKKKGKAVKPKVKVTFAGKTLKNKTDYTLSYAKNKKKGKAKVIVTGKGNFTGKKTITFKIK